MQLIPFKNCLVSEDRKVLKGNNLEDIKKVAYLLESLSFPEGLTNECYNAKISQKALYSDPYHINDYNPKNEFIGITFESISGKTMVNNKHLKHFIQKTSKFFVGISGSPLLIVNKNYVVAISPEYESKIIEYLHF